ncbi:MAG: lactonase family protein [Treponema sp.]|jgi:6-phosphogluconolactonase|nr:lactonase family protein [Treponema sp.]
MKDFLYVSLQTDNCILRFTLRGGVPEDRAVFVLEGGPAPMAANPAKTRLFAGLRKSFELASLRIGPEGDLSLAGKIDLPGDACFVESDKSGRYIFSAYYNAGQIAVHRLEDDDSLREVQRITTERKAHSVRLDRDNRFAYALHTGPNKIYLYQFDSAAGLLRPRDPPWISPGGNPEPRHSCFHPSLDCLYVLHEAGNTLSVYDFDRRSGGITCKQTVSTLPDGGHKGSTGAELRVSGDGRFLYASNRGHDSIVCFRIDQQSGCAERVAFTPVTATPRSFDLSPDGAFLYVAGQSSGELAAYARDRNSGALSEIYREFIGNCPMWVMSLALPAVRA